MNVSNAIMNIPKDIKSWKENSSIDITSIHREWRQHHPANTVVINYYSTKKWIKQHLFIQIYGLVRLDSLRRGPCCSLCRKSEMFVRMKMLQFVRNINSCVNKEKLYNVCSCSGSLAGIGFVRVRSFCPNVRFGWHLSELDRCFFVIGDCWQYSSKGI